MLAIKRLHANPMHYATPLLTTVCLLLWMQAASAQINLIHRYTFGGNTEDAVGGADLVVNNPSGIAYREEQPPGAVEGAPAQSLVFGEGLASKIWAQAAAEPAPTAAQRGTLAFWFKPDRFRDEPGEHDYVLFSGGMQVRVTGPDAIRTSISARPETNAVTDLTGWHFAAFAWDDDAGRGTMYFNGEAFERKWNPGGLNPEEMVFGAARGLGLRSAYAGALYDVQVYDTPADTGELERLFKNPGSTLDGAP